MIGLRDPGDRLGLGAEEVVEEDVDEGLLGHLACTSAPAAKAFSDPVRTMQRTLSLASAAVTAAASSRISVEFSAFSASGRFSRIRAT